MHLTSANHLGEHYCLAHLQQDFRDFSWTEAKTNQVIGFRTRVRFSDHCVTEALKAPPPEGAFTLERPRDPRIFDKRRYDLSFDAHDLVFGLLEKPTQTVFEVRDARNPHRNNHTLFSLQTRAPLNPGERYSVFFTLKRQQSFITDVNLVGLDLYVQSAYPKTTQTSTAQRLPFGKLAEKISKE